MHLLVWFSVIVSCHPLCLYIIECMFMTMCFDKFPILCVSFISGNITLIEKLEKKGKVRRADIKKIRECIKFFSSEFNHFFCVQVKREIHVKKQEASVQPQKDVPGYIVFYIKKIVYDIKKLL